MKVYGITGLAGTGKDEATKVFEKLGYQHISTGNCLRAEAKKQGVDISNRVDLIEFGNRLRKEKHNGYLAELAANEVSVDKAIISGIRNIGEVDFLRMKFVDFKMVKIHASDEICFERTKSRNRENAPQTLIAFKQMRQEDLRTGIGDVINSTSMIIYNNGTLEKLNKLIKNFIESDNVPDWDEYLLNIAEAAGTRGDCCRGRIGAILVQNNRVIATGYNGAPTDIPKCSEVGCLLVESKDAYGRITENCIRTIHSELNAIIQAALYGVSTKGATLYGHYKPCYTCAKALVQAGIKRVVVRKNYHEPLTDILFKQAGIKLKILAPHEEGSAGN
jgi:dCMP deaminase